MQNYISNNEYIEQTLGSCIVIKPEKYQRLLIDEHHPSYHDANTIFSQSKYKYPYLPLYLGDYQIDGVDDLNVNVLRLLIRMNHEDADIYLPEELMILKNFILDNINYHRQYYAVNKNAFIYLTVRCCSYDNMYYKNSQTWHVDGFQGSKIAKHIVEQNVIWCNKLPTEFLLQPMFCEGLDPARHDINYFFNRNAKDELAYEIKENGLYVMNPYNIHRVNHMKYDGNRVFIRLNFSPVEIVDPTNTINPGLIREVIKIRDVRDFLGEYPIDEMEINGIRKK